MALEMWILQDKVPESKAVKRCLAIEMRRLRKQRCGYCDGYGHSGNDCPTDYKLRQLRIGVREQVVLVQELRTYGR